MTREKQDNLEKFLKLQKAALPPIEAKNPLELPPLVRVHYPMWDQIVYGGNCFKEIIQKEVKANKRKSRKNQEFRRQKLYRAERKETKRELKKKVRSEFFEHDKALRRNKRRLADKASRWDSRQYGDNG